MSSKPKDNEYEIELLLKAVEEEVFQFIIVRHNHLSLVQEVADRLHASFPARKLSRVKLPLGYREGIPYKVVEQESGFLLVDNFEKILEDDSARVNFNQRRDLVSSYPIALVVFVPDSVEILRRLQKGLKDFWSIRNLEIELHHSNVADPFLEMMSDFGTLFSSGTADERLSEIAHLQTRIAELKDDPSTLHFRAMMANNIARLFESLSQFENALHWFGISKQLFLEIGDRGGAAMTLSNMGVIHKTIGEYPTALSELEEAMEILEGLGHRESQSRVLNNLSQVYQVQGEYKRALGLLEQSLEIRREMGDLAGEGVALNNIGQAWEGLGEYNKAMDFFWRSLSIRQLMGDKRGVVVSGNNLGLTYEAKGDLNKALELFQESLSLSQLIGDLRDEGVALGNLGRLNFRLGEHKKAEEYLMKSLAIRQEIGDRNGEAITLNNLGHMYLQTRRPETALPFFYKSNRLLRILGSPAMAESDQILAQIHEELGDARYQEIIESQAVVD